MGIAPGCTSVNKSFELSGNVCPIRRRYRYDDVCPLVVFHYFINIIMLNTFRRIMACSAPFAKTDIKIINAYISDIVSLPQAF